MLRDPIFKFHCTRTPDKFKKRTDSKHSNVNLMYNKIFLVVKNGQANSHFVTNKATGYQWKR